MWLILDFLGLINEWQTVKKSSGFKLKFYSLIH
jgi:hypothetical protein